MFGGDSGVQTSFRPVRPTTLDKKIFSNDFKKGKGSQFVGIEILSKLKR